MYPTPDLEKVKIKVGWLDCREEVRNFWSTFESRFSEHQDYLIKLLKQISDKEMTLEDLYTACSYSQSTDIVYNLNILDFVKSRRSGGSPPGSDTDSWKAVFHNLIYADSRGNYILHPIEEADSALHKRFLSPNEVIAFFNGTLQVVGERHYVAGVMAALSLLQSKAPDGFLVVEKHVGIIRQWPESSMVHYAFPPTLLMSEKVTGVSITWCAGCIAHDAYHSKLYAEFKENNPDKHVPAEAYSGQVREQECNRFQLSVMEQIGAPQSEIDWLSSQDGSHWNLPWGDPPRGY